MEFAIPRTRTALATSGSSFAEVLTACPLCSSTRLRRLPTPGHWIGREVFSCGENLFGLQFCRGCSLAFVNPRPTMALLNAFYDRNDYVCHSPESGSSPVAQFLLERVNRHSSNESNRFLDYGCGGGFLLRAASQAKWNAYGFDVGQRAVASCQAQGLAASSRFDDFAEHAFDVVFLNHVFEHIREPRPVLAQCRRLLHNRGRLFVVVPNRVGLRARLALPLLSRHFNVDERHRAFPIHLFYFSVQTLSRTLEKHGFRIAATETFGLGMDEFIGKLEMRTGDCGRESPTVKRKRSAFRRIVKKSYFGAGLGENLLVVAQPA